MTKFTCFIIYAVSLMSVYAESDESGSSEEFTTLRGECLEKFGVTDQNIEDVVKSGDVTKINPCYWVCYFKKIGLLNDKGQYDLNNYRNTMSKYVKDDDDFARVEKLGKKCEPLKDKALSDGESGCERGALLAACFIKHE